MSAMCVVDLCEQWSGSVGKKFCVSVLLRLSDSDFV